MQAKRAIYSYNNGYDNNLRVVGGKGNQYNSNNNNTSHKRQSLNNNNNKLDGQTKI